MHLGREQCPAVRKCQAVRRPVLNSVYIAVCRVLLASEGFVAGSRAGDSYL